jgi:uncharacterized phage-like protein YoqJ
MSEKDITCTISGMRPCKLSNELDISGLLNRLEHEIRQSIFLGYAAFQNGMAMGADIWAAEIVVRLKAEFPHIRLIGCLPCETQADRWTDEWRERYFNALAAADSVLCWQAHYSAGCIQRRNRRMIATSSRLIAVHDGASSGGTAQTVRYARTDGLDVVVVDPRDYLKNPLS